MGEGTRRRSLGWTSLGQFYRYSQGIMHSVLIWDHVMLVYSQNPAHRRDATNGNEGSVALDLGIS